MPHATARSVLLAILALQLNVASAFQPSTLFSLSSLSRQRSRCSAPQLRPGSLRIEGEGGGARGGRLERWAGGKWEGEVEDEKAERIESVKAGVLAAVAGSIAAGPVALLQTEAFFPSAAFTPQWELQVDGLAISLGLFGLVYRYAVRRDPNAQLKQGVVGAFAITRSWAMLQASASCTAVPLSCGAPLIYFNWQMLSQGSGLALENALAFGAAAAALEFAFSKGWVKQFSSK